MILKALIFLNSIAKILMILFFLVILQQKNNDESIFLFALVVF